MRTVNLSFVIPINKTAVKRENSDDKVKQTSSSQERLAELEKLHKAGILTEEEYAKKRKEILDGI